MLKSGVDLNWVKKTVKNNRVKHIGLSKWVGGVVSISGLETSWLINICNTNIIIPYILSNYSDRSADCWHLGGGVETDTWTLLRIDSTNQEA